MEIRIIHAAYDEEGVYVYQAFSPFIVQKALEKGTFGEGFKMERMTWVKPSFGWMLYRCGYAMKPDQEAVLKIKLSHEGFRTVLSRGVPSAFESQLFADQAAWQQAVKTSDVRYQWDPDRTLRGGQMERRAIQLGLSGQTVRQYVNEWILSLEEVTDLARTIGEHVKSKRADLPPVPQEREYPVDDTLRQRLMMGGES